MKKCNVLSIIWRLTFLLLAPGSLFAQNQNCTIIVPDHPLTAQGLATPYQLFATDPAGGLCDEANANSSAFVQAAILDPATGQISIYNPVVIDQGFTPAPTTTGVVVPTLPDHAIVALWFGFNGNNLIQQGASPNTLQQAHCVNGLPNGNYFSQFSYCNAPAFFKAANRAIRLGQLQVPPPGTASDGLPCPTVRDFFVVDQDQSDNLPVTYLVDGTGLVAQNTVANAAQLTGATTIGNPSDNGLLDRFIDVSLGCTPWKAPNLADPGQIVPALALNELQARAWQQSPVAMIPAGDPMARDDNGNGPIDLAKVNAYRRGVDQPVAFSFRQADTARYCRNMLRIAPPRLLSEQALLSPTKSPLPDVANSLYTFMTQRFVASYNLLGCAELVPIADPISVTLDANGVAVSATINVPAYSQARTYVGYWDRRDRHDDDDAKAADRD